MKITLNGGLFINDEEFFFDDLEVEIDLEDECEDFDFDFDEFEGFDFNFDEEDKEEEYAFDCDCNDCNCEDDFLDPLDRLIEDYVEVLMDECICPDCIRDVLQNYTYELLCIED